jgi:23S rRNA (cytidine2498-2'-O)-methyltransferase
VISVDKAPLAESLSNRKNIQFLKKDAFKLKPADVEPVDWLFSDIICDPKRLLELVQLWRSENRAKNFVCTIKFKGKTDFETMQKFKEIPNSKVLHLYNNKHEVTWYLRLPSDARS